MKVKVSVGKHYLNGWGDRVHIIHKLAGADTTTPFVGIVSNHNFTTEDVETYAEDGCSIPGMTTLTLLKGDLITEVSPLVFEPTDYEEHA